MIGYFDRDGQPIGPQEFDRLKWDADGRVSDYAFVGRDTVGDVEVSTVWLGLDHAYPGQKDGPIIFESMLFGGDRNYDCIRYRTLAEARAGHIAAVEALRAGREPWA